MQKKRAFANEILLIKLNLSVFAEATSSELGLKEAYIHNSNLLNLGSGKN